MSLHTPIYRLHKGPKGARPNRWREDLPRQARVPGKRREVPPVWSQSGSPCQETASLCTWAASQAATILVNELILAFWEHAKQRYVKNGQPTSERRSFKIALRPVCHLYGREPVINFGPLALIACRQKLIEARICRKRINQHVGRIRQCFKWGVARELVPETIWRALCAVEGLKFGEARETAKIKPVAE